MACKKFRIPCNECEFACNQGKCPGVNFWNDLCEKPLVKEDEILQQPTKRVFGKLFKSLQDFLPQINIFSLSSNKVSLLKRNEIIMLLKAIRSKDKDLIAPDYVNLSNENMSKLLYRIMIKIYENRNKLQA